MGLVLYNLLRSIIVGTIFLVVLVGLALFVISVFILIAAALGFEEAANRAVQLRDNFIERLKHAIEILIP